MPKKAAKKETQPKTEEDEVGQEVPTPEPEGGARDKKKVEKNDKDGAEDLTEMFGEKKKKKKKEDKDNDAEGEEKKKKKKREPCPIIVKVLSINPVPKKDRLRLCRVRIFDDREVEVVTNAPNVVVGGNFVVALPGVKTADGVEVDEQLVGGVNSCGMFCGPKELGWPCDILDAKLPVMLDDSAEAGEPASALYERAVEAFGERQTREAVAAQAKEEAKGKKGKKGKAKAQEDDEDLDALLSEFKEAPAATNGKSKQGKKGGQRPAEEDEREEAEDQEDEKRDADGEAEEEEEEASPSRSSKEEVLDAKTLANRKKKDKKKAKQAGGASGGADEEDFDALVNEFKEEEPAAAAAAEAAAPPAAEEPPEKEREEGHGGAGEEALDAKAIANRKKKEKKKAKKEEATGGEGMWGSGDAGGADAADAAAAAAASSSAPEAAAAPPPAAAPAAAAAKKGAAGGKEKKESAIVRAAREKLELEKKLEEEKRAFDEEQKRIIEEEEKKEQEEKDRIEALKKQKREARQAKIEKMKADGTYLTAKQKVAAARAAQLREQFGFSLADGDEDDEEAETVPEPKPTKRPIASKKKKKSQSQAEEEEEEAAPPAAAAAAGGEEEEEEAEPEKVAPPETNENEAEDDDGDDWEDKSFGSEEPGGGGGKAAAAGGAEEAESEEDEEDEEDEGKSESSDDFLGYRSPIVVIMGHVDTGKTKLLDKIRRTNVQEGEAGGITQQIGATFFPDIALEEQTKKVDPEFELEMPGLLIIDTPGHESFNNLRARGSSLCDIAILVIDIMHGLEPQTVESLEMLKKRKCPFVIAMNKIDKMYQWNAGHYTCVKDALGRQEQFVQTEFRKRFDEVVLQLNERGLNCSLYFENDEIGKTVSIVPTSALTGEGVPDLLYMILHLTQELMADKLEVEEELQCTVIEVKNIDGLGTTIDVVLVNGTLKEGDQIVIAGMNAPIVTTIRALLTPQPMKEMRVKSDYLHHAKINTSMGVKICAPGLDEAVAGTELFVVGPDDDVDELKEEVQEGFASMLSDFEKQTEGVYVKASTLGSLEALLSFLTDMKIPVFEVGIGEVHQKDVKRAMIMKEKRHPEYAVILAFDVKVNSDAVQQAAKEEVEIFTADIIYHLFDKFKTYMEKVLESKKTESRQEAIFPVMIQIDKQLVFRKQNPIVFGCEIIGGQLRIGTPLCIPDKDNLEIGRVAGIEKDHKAIQMARRPEKVCVKVEPSNVQKHIAYGRHFDFNNKVCSLINRQSIDTLKENFKDEMKKEDWEVVIGLKSLFGIQ